jgi:hypothetical protein
MNEAWQDEELAKADLRHHERLVADRLPWESTWREIDERFPDGAGGFNNASPGALRGGRNYDTTHITSNERFAAAGVAITTPEGQDYIKPRFSDPELMKDRDVQLWCERAGPRLYDIRHAQHTGFSACANEDWDQLGRYGTSPVWQEAMPRRGMFYRTLHLSSCWIDVDFAGLVDTVQRKYSATARQLEQQFGRENLTPKMLDALDKPGKEGTLFECLHLVGPNTEWDQDKLDHRAFPIASRYLALGEKIYLRRGGYHTSPISVSRHSTSPGEKYGRSPAIKMLPTINGINAMRHTTLRALHKAVDPALLFNNDDGVTKLVSKPGGMNPGLVSDDGRPMVHRMPGGENGLPIVAADLEAERGVVRTAFLEEFYKILTDPNSRMTTVEVLEVMAKQGVLVRPFASRYAAEKQHPMTNRDLDLALRAGQIEPLPPVVVEAGAWPVIEYENPLAALARAESTARTMRFVEYATQVSTLEQTSAADTVDIDQALREGAAEIGVKPSILRDPKEVEALRAKRAEDQAGAADAEMFEKAAGGVLDLTKAGEISRAA